MADPTAQFRWAISGLSSPARWHSSVLCATLKLTAQWSVLLAFPRKANRVQQWVHH